MDSVTVAVDVIRFKLQSLSKEELVTIILDLSKRVLCLESRLEKEEASKIEILKELEQSRNNISSDISDKASFTADDSVMITSPQSSGTCPNIIPPSSNFMMSTSTICSQSILEDQSPLLQIRSSPPLRTVVSPSLFFQTHKISLEAQNAFLTSAELQSSIHLQKKLFDRFTEKLRAAQGTSSFSISFSTLSLIGKEIN